MLKDNLTIGELIGIIITLIIGLIIQIYYGTGYYFLLGALTAEFAYKIFDN